MHVRMTSMMSSVEQTDLVFEISVALDLNCFKILRNRAGRGYLCLTGHLLQYKRARTWQNQQKECGPSKDSDTPSLIRVFAVRMKKAWVLSYSLSAQRRRPVWSESSLGAHSFCWFCHVTAQNNDVLIWLKKTSFQPRIFGGPNATCCYRFSFFPKLWSCLCFRSSAVLSHGEMCFIPENLGCRLSTNDITGNYANILYTLCL